MLVRRESAWSLEMLAVLVVLMLVPTWSDGLLLTKCELKSQLEEAFSKLQVENAADIITKLTCTVENISGFNTSLVKNIDQFDPRTPFVYDEDYPSEMGELLLTSNTVSKDYVFPESMEGTEEPFIPIHVVSEDKFIPGRNKVQPEEWFVPVDTQARMRREAASNDERDGSGEESSVIPVDAQTRKRREVPSYDERDGSGEESWVIPVDTHARKRREVPSNDEKDGSGEESSVSPVDAQARKRREAPSNDERDGSGEESSVSPVDAQARKRREVPSNDERDGSGEESWVIPVDTQARKRREAPSNDERDGSGEDSLVIPVDAQDRKRREVPSYDERDGSGEESWVIPVDVQARKRREVPSYDERDGSGEESSVSPVDAQARKRREAPSYDERDGSGEESSVSPVDAQARKRREAPSEQTLLYGIFQLSDITCNSGSSYSLDLCQVNCSALTDDDITDDIACLMHLDKTMAPMTFLQECLAVEPSDYFAECG